MILTAANYVDTAGKHLENNAGTLIAYVQSQRFAANSVNTVELQVTLKH